MRVLHLFDASLSPAAAGVLGVVRRLRAEPAARVGPDEAADAPEPDFVLRRRWPGPIARWLGLGTKAGELPADLLHCWSASLAAAVAGRGWPTVASVLTRPDRDQLRLLRAAAWKGAAIVAGSNALARRLEAAGLPAERVTVIAPAAEPEPVDPAARDAARRRLGLGDAELLAVTVAEHRGDRGPYRCIWAAEILHQRALPVRVGLLGDCRAVAYALRFARDTGGLDAVFADADAATLWAAADAAVLYEDRGDGLATAATALAHRVPLLATDAGELGATFVDERTALLLAPATPRLLARTMQRLLDRPDLRATLAAAGQHASVGDLLDPAGMVGRLGTLYAQLAHRGARQPDRSTGGRE